jgi:hypothetical protein
MSAIEEYTDDLVLRFKPYRNNCCTGYHCGFADNTIMLGKSEQPLLNKWLGYNTTQLYPVESCPETFEEYTKKQEKEREEKEKRDNEKIKADKERVIDELQRRAICKDKKFQQFIWEYKEYLNYYFKVAGYEWDWENQPLTWKDCVIPSSTDL